MPEKTDDGSVLKAVLNHQMRRRKLVCFGKVHPVAGPPAQFEGKIVQMTGLIPRCRWLRRELLNERVVVDHVGFSRNTYQFTCFEGSWLGRSRGRSRVHRRAGSTLILEGLFRDAAATLIHISTVVVSSQWAPAFRCSVRITHHRSEERRVGK